jgi:hypothetical protein
VLSATQVAQNTLGSSNMGGARGMIKAAKEPNCMCLVWPGAVYKVEKGTHYLHVRKH